MVKLRIWPDGDKIWSLNKQWHRAHGPAVTWAGVNHEWWWHDEEVDEFALMMLSIQENTNG